MDSSEVASFQSKTKTLYLEKVLCDTFSITSFRCLSTALYGKQQKNQAQSSMCKLNAQIGRVRVLVTQP